jgi:Tfp pilus assembly protein PilF
MACNRPLKICVAALLLVGGAGCASSDRSGVDATFLERLAKQASTELPADRREALLEQADAALKAARHEDAYSRYVEVLRHDPRNARALVGASEVLLALGDAQKALLGFEQIGEDSPLAALGYQGRGLALVLLGKLDLALKQLDLAVAKDPSLWRAWNARGYVFDLSAKWPLADESYRKAVAAKSDAPIVHNNRGMSLLMRGRYGEAFAAFQRALQLDPGLPAARANMRLALAWQGKYLEAAAGVPGPESAPTFNNIGFIAMKKGNYAQAELYFSQAIKASPAHYEKAERNLQYVKQLQSARAGDETRALSSANQ